MERFIHNQNLKLYQKLADPKMDGAEREIIKPLLAEEEAREIPPSPPPDASSLDLQRCMDRQALLQHLFVAERQIAGGEVEIVRQENLITRMELDGKDNAEAKTLLIPIRTTLALLRQARQRILDLLDQ